MKMPLLSYLICPKCGLPIYLDKITKRQGNEIMTGWLRCHSQEHRYYIENGVPDFVDADTDKGQLQVSDSYGKKWQLLKDYGFTEATRQFQQAWYLQKFGWKSIGRLRRFLKAKKLILDVGCGLGRDTKTFAENSKAQVFGVDISDSIWVAQEKFGQLSNVHLIKADMMHMPFLPNFFDFISCDQALHHTPDTAQSFLSLVEHVRKKGQIAIYVYKKKGDAREFADDLLRKYTTEMDYADCMTFAMACTVFGKIVASLNLGLQRDIYWNLFKCFWDDKYDFKTNMAINLDWYHPKYAWRHTEEEVGVWFEEAELRVLNVDVCPSGISMRGYKR